MVDQAKKELEARRQKIDQIIGGVRSDDDASKIDAQKLGGLAQAASIDTTTGKGAILTRLETIDDLRGFLEQPAKEFVDPLHQALGSS